MLEKLKTALQITTTIFDNELADMIAAARLDLGIAGVTIPAEFDAIVERAIISYCACHYELEHGDEARFEKLKKAYDEQKSQLSMATGYTVW